MRELRVVVKFPSKNVYHGKHKSKVTAVVEKINRKATALKTLALDFGVPNPADIKTWEDVLIQFRKIETSAKISSRVKGDGWEIVPELRSS